MLDLKLNKIGTISIQNKEISVVGFSSDGAMCREVAILTLVWAIGELQRELDALIDAPGGSGNVVVD